MQRFEDEVLLLVRTQMAGDHLGAATGVHLMDIAAEQHFTMAEPGGD